MTKPQLNADLSCISNAIETIWHQIPDNSIAFHLQIWYDETGKRHESYSLSFQSKGPNDLYGYSHDEFIASVNNYKPDKDILKILSDKKASIQSDLAEIEAQIHNLKATE